MIINVHNMCFTFTQETIDLESLPTYVTNNGCKVYFENLYLNITQILFNCKNISI